MDFIDEHKLFDQRRQVERSLSSLLGYLASFSPAFIKDERTGEPVRTPLPVYFHTPDEGLNELVESVSYRFGALQFVVQILNAKVEHMRSINFTNHDNDQRLQYASQEFHFEHLYLLDNLVFNTYSIFDYVGRVLIKLLFKQVRIILLNPGQSKFIAESQYDWVNFNRLACDRIEGFKIDDSLATVKEQIKSMNSDFVSKLSAYRNRIIHNELPRSEREIDQYGKLHIYAPRKFINEVGLTNRKSDQKQDKVPIAQAVENLCDRVASSIIDLGNELVNAYMQIKL